MIVVNPALFPYIFLRVPCSFICQWDRLRQKVSEGKHLHDVRASTEVCTHNFALSSVLWTVHKVLKLTEANNRAQGDLESCSIELLRSFRVLLLDEMKSCDVLRREAYKHFSGVENTRPCSWDIIIAAVSFAYVCWVVFLLWRRTILELWGLQRQEAKVHSNQTYEMKPVVARHCTFWSIISWRGRVTSQGVSSYSIHWII